MAAISERSRPFFDYFTQMFAQVTNPPLDAIREEMVTSLAGTIGPEENLLEPGPASCRQIRIAFPVLDNDELAKLVAMNRNGQLPEFQPHVIRGLYRVEDGGAGLRYALEKLCKDASKAIRQGGRVR